jgi:hypothetical protein
MTPFNQEGVPMAFERLRDYLDNHMEQVPGWCSRQLWQIVHPIVEFQNSIGVLNPVAEIGIYQGKFFLGLLATKDAARGNFAIDVFSMQQFNMDGAGEGNRAALIKHAEGFGVDISSIEILECDSTDISPAQIEQIRATSGGGFSLFSVDGCHLPEHTVNDISVAMSLVEGVSKMYFSGYPKFIPLVVAHNKLFLCHISYHSKYLEIISKSLALMSVSYKRVQRYGYECLTAHLDPGSTEFWYRYEFDRAPVVGV